MFCYWYHNNADVSILPVGFLEHFLECVCLTPEEVRHWCTNHYKFSALMSSWSRDNVSQIHYALVVIRASVWTSSGLTLTLDIFYGSWGCLCGQCSCWLWFLLKTVPSFCGCWCMAIGERGRELPWIQVGHKMFYCQLGSYSCWLTLSLARTDISVLGSELFQKIVTNWSFELWTKYEY